MLLSFIAAAGPLPASGFAHAEETVRVGAVGSASAALWPTFIGVKQGFFRDEGLTLDLVYAPANAGVLQQLAAGSIDMAVSSGLVDPIRAVDKGADVAILRIEIEAPPYALLAKPEIKRMAELRGKTISLGGPKDITRIFVERMLAPAGVKPGEFDMVYAGATSARFAALTGGAVDAAILTAPYNFHAEAAGFTNLGLTVDYARDLPFSGTSVNRAWAAGHAATVRHFLAAFAESIQWFNDPQNRARAVAILKEESKQDQKDVEASYDFLRQGFYEPTGKVSKAKLGALLAVLKNFGDVDPSLTVERLVLPGVTELAE